KPPLTLIDDCNCNRCPGRIHPAVHQGSMTAWYKHLVKLVRQGIRPGNKDAPQSPLQAPTKWTLIRETAIKQYSQDAVFDHMGRLGKERVEHMQGPGQKADVKRGERRGD